MVIHTKLLQELLKLLNQLKFKITTVFELTPIVNTLGVFFYKNILPIKRIYTIIKTTPSIFPNTNFFVNKFLVAGTHRLFICGMCGYDYPMFLQIPKGQKQFRLELSCKNNMFYPISQLCKSNWRGF